MLNILITIKEFLAMLISFIIEHVKEFFEMSVMEILLYLLMGWVIIYALIFFARKKKEPKYLNRKEAEELTIENYVNAIKRENEKY